MNMSKSVLQQIKYMIIIILQTNLQEASQFIVSIGNMATFFAFFLISQCTYNISKR